MEKETNPQNMCYKSDILMETFNQKFLRPSYSLTDETIPLGKENWNGFPEKHGTDA